MYLLLERHTNGDWNEDREMLVRYVTDNEQIAFRWVAKSDLGLSERCFYERSFRTVEVKIS